MEMGFYKDRARPFMCQCFNGEGTKEDLIKNNEKPFSTQGFQYLCSRLTETIQERLTTAVEGKLLTSCDHSTNFLLELSPSRCLILALLHSLSNFDALLSLALLEYVESFIPNRSTHHKIWLREEVLLEEREIKNALKFAHFLKNYRLANVSKHLLDILEFPLLNGLASNKFDTNIDDDFSMFSVFSDEDFVSDNDCKECCKNYGSHSNFLGEAKFAPLTDGNDKKKNISPKKHKKSRIQISNQKEKPKTTNEEEIVNNGKNSSQNSHAIIQETLSFNLDCSSHSESNQSCDQALTGTCTNDSDFQKQLDKIINSEGLTSKNADMYGQPNGPECITTKDVHDFQMIEISDCSEVSKANQTLNLYKNDSLNEGNESFSEKIEEIPAEVETKKLEHLANFPTNTGKEKDPCTDTVKATEKEQVLPAEAESSVIEKDYLPNSEQINDLSTSGSETNKEDKTVSGLITPSFESNTDIKDLMAGLKSFNTKAAAGDTLLHMAVSSRNLNFVQTLIGLIGADLNSANGNGITPLHLAVNLDCPEIFEFLLEKGANINSKSNDGLTPIHSALYIDNLTFFKTLLRHGAAIDTENIEGSTLMHTAVCRGNSEAIMLLIENNISVNKKNLTGFTPLHLAVTKNFPEIVDILCRSGADLDEQNNAGMAPLHIAVTKGILELVDCLIKKGASINLQNSLRLTPIHIAVSRSCLDIVEYFIKCGADLKSRNNQGLQPLHTAVEKGDPAIIRCLVAAGVSVNSKTKYNKTPLHLAVSKELFDICRVLIELGADIEAVDTNGLNCLYLAISSGNEAIIKYLIEKGANIHKTDNDGRSQLHWAAWHGNLKVAIFLIKQGLSASSKTSSGNTPLHFAAHKGHVQLVKLLLQSGACINETNDRGWTPLFMAISNKNEQVADMIKIKGGKSFGAVAEELSWRNEMSDNPVELKREHRLSEGKETEVPSECSDDLLFEKHLNQRLEAKKNENNISPKLYSEEAVGKETNSCSFEKYKPSKILQKTKETEKNPFKLEVKPYIYSSPPFGTLPQHYYPMRTNSNTLSSDDYKSGFLRTRRPTSHNLPSQNYSEKQHFYNRPIFRRPPPNGQHRENHWIVTKNKLNILEHRSQICGSRSTSPTFDTYTDSS